VDHRPRGAAGEGDGQVGGHHGLARAALHRRHRDDLPPLGALFDRRRDGGDGEGPPDAVDRILERGRVDRGVEHVAHAGPERLLEQPRGQFGRHQDGADLGPGAGEPLDLGQAGRIRQAGPEHRHHRPAGRLVLGQGRDVGIDGHFPRRARLAHLPGEAAGQGRVGIDDGEFEESVGRPVGHGPHLHNMAGEHS
jgi:hypothetical protein